MAGSSSRRVFLKPDITASFGPSDLLYPIINAMPLVPALHPVQSIKGLEVHVCDFIPEHKVVFTNSHGDIAVIDLRNQYEVTPEAAKFTMIYVDSKTANKIWQALDKSEKCGMIKEDGKAVNNANQTIGGASANLPGGGEVHREANRQTP